MPVAEEAQAVTPPVGLGGDIDPDLHHDCGVDLDLLIAAGGPVGRE